MAETAMKMPEERQLRLDRVTVIRIVTVFVVWAIYEAAAQSGLFFEGVVPSSVLVVRALFETLADPGFYPHLFRTAQEVLSGFVLGVLAGIAVGIVFGSSQFIARMLNPWVYFISPAPKIIFLPIIFLVFGVGIGSKIAMAGFSAFFPVVIATYAAMREIPGVYIRVGIAFNASWSQMVTKVYIPSLVAPVITSLRLALGVAIIGTLLAEIKLSNVGLGHLIIQHYNFLRIPEMYAVLLLTFAIAVSANAFMGWLANRVEHDRK